MANLKDLITKGVNMPEILLNTDEVRLAIQELKVTSGELDAKLIRINNVLINIARNWKSPRIARTLEEYDNWSVQYKKQNDKLFEIVQILERALQDWEMSNQ